MMPVIPSISPIDRRQDLPEVYALNGAVYVAKCEWVLKSRTFMAPETVAYPMPHERSVDIDSETDLRWCDFILSVVSARR
jgi:N-acylneuraminate cytidylyltransferase